MWLSEKRHAISGRIPRCSTMAIAGGVRSSDLTLQWIRSNMPRTRRILSSSGLLKSREDLSNIRLAASIHFEPKLLVLLEGLRARNVEIMLIPCNVDTVKRSFVEGAAEMGCGMVDEGVGTGREDAVVEEVLHWRPTHTLEMGADLTVAAHRRAHASTMETTIRSAVECTRSGLSRIERLSSTSTPLAYPIWDVDSIPVKNGLHNRFMVGLTTWTAFLNQTALSLQEKKVAVVGYGLVGEGLASAAHNFGAAVRVVEIDPSRAASAGFAGWDVLGLEEALVSSDVIVTATGTPGVVASHHFDMLKDGAILLNAGHQATEIDVSALHARSIDGQGGVGGIDLAPYLREYRIGVVDGTTKRIRLFAEGSMANLVAGVGDSINAFDATLAVIAATLIHAMDDTQDMIAGLQQVPRSVWTAALET